jgi:uncharacterized membrane protein HdeD (DUF308 family)
MAAEDPGREFPDETEPLVWERAFVSNEWRTSLVIGVATLVLGIIVALHPSGSLSVIAVLLGILLVVSGLLHLARVFDRREEHRGWLGSVGILLIVLGVVLMRHIDLTTAIMGLLIGIAWIVQGLSWLLSALPGRTQREAGRGWWALFGAISLIAGVVVVATPVSSVTVLATLVGIWFAILGAAEIIGAFIIRHAITRASRDVADVDRGDRAGTSGQMRLRPQLHQAEPAGPGYGAGAGGDPELAVDRPDMGLDRVR